ncbi:MAG: rRNA maturation RNase YbeY [Bacilli bacterium]|nr:rRNA maturation RNase YbeY [Bacilli bacterium]
MNQFDIIDEVGYKSYDFLEEILKFTLKKLAVKNACFSVILTSDEVIKELNTKYRGISKTTDVLSFALNDGVHLTSPINMLGDIYISVPVMIKQAKDYQTGEVRELSFLTLHGLLHLLGYNHETKEDEEAMFKLQKEILDEKKI